jgi:hypothetical protein
LSQVTAAYLQFPNEEGEISLTDDDDNDPNDEDYTDDTPTNLASTLNQEHTVTAVLGLTDMTNAMATQKEEILEEEDNDGAINDQVNETEGVDNIEELQQQLLNQVDDVDHQIRILQEASDRNMITHGEMNAQVNSDRGIRIRDRCPPTDQNVA